MKYINLHTHARNEGNEVIAIVNHYPEDGALPDNGFFSVGHHPWKVEDYWKKIMQFGFDDLELREMQAIASSPQVIAIGECGLDRAITTDMGLQKMFFLKQILISEQIQKPLIIHCVRAYEEIMALRKATKPKMPWILHSFKGNVQTQSALLKFEGIYFSFGKWLFQEKSDVPSTFALLPIDRCFLESDTTDFKMEEVYQKASEISGYTLEQLKAQIYQNFIKVFGHVD